MQWVDARKVLVTDDGHPAATPLQEATRVAPEREVRPVLDRGEVAVLGGFIGATVEGSRRPWGAAARTFQAR